MKLLWNNTPRFQADLAGLVLTPKSPKGNIVRYFLRCISFPIRRNSVLPGFNFSLFVDIHDWTNWMDWFPCKSTFNVVPTHCFPLLSVHIPFERHDRQEKTERLTGHTEMYNYHIIYNADHDTLNFIIAHRQMPGLCIVIWGTAPMFTEALLKYLPLFQ